MAWPLLVGLGLAAGGAAANYFGNKEQSENLQDAYDDISAATEKAVGQNASDIAAYRNMVNNIYGGGAAKYGDALQKFLDSEVYQNKAFSYGDQPGQTIEAFLDPAMNQRVDAAMQAINNASASGGNRFSSDYINRIGSKQQSMASEEWEKAYQKLMQDRQTALNEYNVNSQNNWNNYNANQNRLQAAVNAYGNDRDKYYEGQGTAMTAGIQNRLGGLNTQAQTIMGAANAKDGTSWWDLGGNVLGSGAQFMGKYFGGVK